MPLTDHSTGRCLGLIGGLGVGSAVHYYLELSKAHTARGSVLNLVMVHADVNRVLKDAAAGNTSELATYLAQLIERLAAAGAELAVIPAVTPHICAPELATQSPIPLVNLVEEIAREIHARHLRRVALFGTRFTVTTNIFGQLPGVDVVMPAPDEIDSIHNAYLQLVDAGRGTTHQYETLRRIAHTLRKREKVETIVLAGTELSLVFNQANTDFPHIDGARLHLQAIMRRAFDSPR